MHACTHTGMHTYVRTYMHSFIHSFIHTLICNYIHACIPHTTYIRTDAHTYICIHVDVCSDCVAPPDLWWVFVCQYKLTSPFHIGNLCFWRSWGSDVHGPPGKSVLLKSFGCSFCMESWVCPLSDSVQIYQCDWKLVLEGLEPMRICHLCGFYDVRRECWNILEFSGRILHQTLLGSAISWGF